MPGLLLRKEVLANVSFILKERTKKSYFWVKGTRAALKIRTGIQL
jgi:hypothetical protein